MVIIQNALYFLLLLMVFGMDNTQAKAQSLSLNLSPEHRLYEVEPNDTAYKGIFRIIEKIFSSPLGGQLCNITGHRQFWEAFLGITASDADSLLQAHCHGTLNITPFRVLPKKKKYFFLIDADEKFPFESWTDFRNQTYIFVSSAYINEGQLFKILVHEIAISLDTKNTLMDIDVEDRMEIQANQSFDGGEAWENIPLSTRISTPRLLSKVDKLLSWVGYKPIQMTFLVMRALNVERVAYGQIPLTSIDYEICSAEFRELHDFFKKLNLQPQVGGFENGFQLMQNILSREGAPKSDSEANFILKMILDKALLFPIAPIKSFCTYMSTPRFWSSKHISGSFGPRPRFTGGAGAAPIQNLSTEAPSPIKSDLEYKPLDLKTLKEVQLDNSTEFWRYRLKSKESDRSLLKRNGGSFE